MRKTCSSAKTAPTASFTSLRRGEILADRLFDDDAGLRRDQLVLADAGADLVDQVGPDREIEGAHLVLAAVQRLRQAGPSRSPVAASAAT